MINWRKKDVGTGDPLCDARFPCPPTNKKNIVKYSNWLDITSPLLFKHLRMILACKKLPGKLTSRSGNWLPPLHCEVKTGCFIVCQIIKSMNIIILNNTMTWKHWWLYPYLVMLHMSGGGGIGSWAEEQWTTVQSWLWRRIKERHHSWVLFQHLSFWNIFMKFLALF